ncbi:MAG: hypothetical protein OXB96_02845 [Candidatus Kaiserbacteria bacterium]|nr:hypothetical protein [Candidatus Kaiserbacteria bacterium]
MYDNSTHRGSEERQQGCEIFFLQVGENDSESSQSGDAIVLTMGNRFSNNRDDYKIIVIDGAFTHDAQTVKKHLNLLDAKNENDKLQIDLMVSTHSDQDHISGLIKLVEDDDVEIKKLWVHDCNKITGNITCSVDQVKNLIWIAGKRGIPMEEPFAGLSYNPDDIDACIEVLGPTGEYYEELMCSVDKVYVKGKRKNAFSVLGRACDALRNSVGSMLEHVFDTELLKDPDENATSNSNNSSAILLLKFFKNDQVSDLALFTADAGVPALEKVFPALEEHGWSEYSVKRFLQIPHHGSRRNVGPTLLDELLGEKEFNCRRGSCFVSAHEKDESHPKVQVLNAFTRRGYRDIEDIYPAKRHHMGDTPSINGWETAEKIDLLLGEEEEEHD